MPGVNSYWGDGNYDEVDDLDGGTSGYTSLTYFPSASRKTLVGLRFEDGRWIGQPESFFRPHGLLVAGAPRGCWLTEWTAGKTIQYPVGPDPIALDTFLLLEMLGERAAPARPFNYTVSPTERIVITVKKADGTPLGPPASFTLWGLCARR